MNAVEMNEFYKRLHAHDLEKQANHSRAEQRRVDVERLRIEKQRDYAETRDAHMLAIFGKPIVK